MNEPKFKVELAEYKGNKLNSKVEELINKLSKTRGLFCECLIDQNRFIGNDPVGHACMKKATRKITIPEGTLYLCDSCRDLLETEPDRVTYKFC